MRIAIVGSGISGLVAAHLLAPQHEITVFEADDRIGGHTHTVTVRAPEGPLPVDTGFIVFNEANYPGLVRLFERLGVRSRASEMSFGVRDDAAGLEYCGTSLDTFFADRRALLRPSAWRLLAGILRFQRSGRGAAHRLDDQLSLRDWAQRAGLGPEVIQHFLIPLGASIWSAPPDQLLDHPARFYLDFLANHRMLHLTGRPVWRTVEGGSCAYLEPLTRPFRDRIRISTPVRCLRRESSGVRLSGASDLGVFDEVIVACHSDQALRMLERPTDTERAILSALPYQDNDVVLHGDASVLPRLHKARASWNYRLQAGDTSRALLTYDMNRLQGLRSSAEHLVSLNHRVDAIDPAKVHRRFVYAHPQATQGAAPAKARHAELIRHHRVSYCGAYFGAGFHEDGLQSAVRVAAAFGSKFA